MDWIKYIVPILSGIAVCIPLAIKLVESVRLAVKERNWTHLLDMVMRLMKEAEESIEDGATRKAYVLAQISASAEFMNYDIDMEVISKMIDALCDMSKVVNAAPVYLMESDVEIDTPEEE